MPVDAKTIQIFLPDGEPRGIRIAEITTRIVQAIQVPRVHLDRIMKRSEMNHIGIYLLFGESEEQGRPLVYIGQTEDLRGRLKDHHAKKDFWTTAVLLVSKTDSFTLAHIKYLEWHAIKQASVAGRYILENANAGSEPHIPEPMEADTLDAFETGGILLSTLGFPLFEPLAPPPPPGELTYWCIGADFKAQGRLVEDGFVVLKGSTVRADISRSAHSYITTKRQSLRDEGALVPEGKTFRFARDSLFMTPSGAAGVVMGQNVSGWKRWKTDDGRTLRQIERPETSPSEGEESSASDSPNE